MALIKAKIFLSKIYWFFYLLFRFVSWQIFFRSSHSVQRYLFFFYFWKAICQPYFRLYKSGKEILFVYFWNICLPWTFIGFVSLVQFSISIGNISQEMTKMKYAKNLTTLFGLCCHTNVTNNWVEWIQLDNIFASEG